jgi:hypothetical protein
MKLICENEVAYREDLEVLIEQQNTAGNRNIKVKGPYIIAETKNANGRIYDSSVMESAVKQYNKDYISTKGAIGEMNHPESTELDYNNACHKILSLERDGDIWIGESQVLIGCPKGDLLAGLWKCWKR